MAKSTLSHVKYSISDLLMPVFKAVITTGFKWTSQFDVSLSISSSLKYLKRCISPLSNLTFLTVLRTLSSVSSQSLAFVNILFRTAVNLFAYAIDKSFLIISDCIFSIAITLNLSSLTPLKYFISVPMKDFSLSWLFSLPFA
ncbi:MAG: hypothetical protein ACYCSQ_04990 [bacterium]